MPGTLYIVATPIGNLEDMTYRAVRILDEVDVIAAEDTRHTKKLLNHFSISTPLLSYFREKEAQRSEQLIEQLLEGRNIALVSDAGTPGISDPGAVLVRQARTAGICIVPIPGPSALSAALSCAGLTPGSFTFIGFVPAKPSQRKKMLQSLSASRYPLVFYESPHRIGSFIADAHVAFGDRGILWAREMTKKYEDIEETTLAALDQKIATEKIRGELVLIIHPGERERPGEASVEEILTWYRDNTDMSLKDVCKTISAELGTGRSEIYRKALEIWNIT